MGSGDTWDLPPLGSSGEGWFDVSTPREGKRAPLTTVLVAAGQSSPSPAPSSWGWERLAKVTEDVTGRAGA